MENEPGTNKCYFAVSLRTKAKQIWETFCLSPELIPSDKRPIPQSMVLIALANVLYCQMMIVYSPIFKYYILLF